MNEIPNLPPGLRVVVQGDVEANQAWVDLWVRVLVAMREGMPEELAEKPPAMTAQLAKVMRGALERVGAENLRRRNIVSGPEIVSATIENEGKRANMLLEIGSAIPMYWLQLEYQTVDARLANVAQKFPASDTDNQSNLSISISPSSYAQPPGPVGSIVDERLSPIPLLVKGVQFEVTARAVFFDGDWERHRMPEPYIPQFVVLFGLNGITPATKLSSIDLSKVGPAATLSFAPLASRLNIITGDNGLGKSFLTDIVWWALTETWAGAGTWTGFKAQPSDPDDATISAETVCGGMSDTMIARWDRRGQVWATEYARTLQVGLVLYARADGSIAIWDSHRNTTPVHLPNGATVHPPDDFFFSSSELLFGLDRKDLRENNYRICNGLIADWGIWQRAKEPQFDLLTRVLATLGPDGAELVPGEVLQPFTEDVRHFPSVRMPYAQDVPIVFAPAGVKRMVGLAYALTWAISEHRRLVNAQGGVPARSVVLLIDEPETHLHPRWQRTILPSLLKALEVGFGEPKVDVQMFVATHSPLVLASLEPHFDPAQDALWKLDLVDGEVKLERDRWYKRGTAGAWLTSDVFDLGDARSREAEQALNEAREIIRARVNDPQRLAAVTARLVQVLPEDDPMLTRWRAFVEDVEVGQ